MVGSFVVQTNGGGGWRRGFVFFFGEGVRGEKGGREGLGFLFFLVR